MPSVGRIESPWKLWVWATWGGLPICTTSRTASPARRHVPTGKRQPAFRLQLSREGVQALAEAAVVLDVLVLKTEMSFPTLLVDSLPPECELGHQESVIRGAFRPLGLHVNPGSPGLASQRLGGPDVIRLPAQPIPALAPGRREPQGGSPRHIRQTFAQMDRM